MGVYLPNMEMPTRCGDCKMYVEDVYCCNLLGREIENPWADDGVELDCPLVPVPEHGDLIDRKQLIKSDHQHYEYMSDEFYVTVRDIENAPTIIQASKEAVG